MCFCAPCVGPGPGPGHRTRNQGALTPGPELTHTDQPLLRETARWLRCAAPRQGQHAVVGLTVCAELPDSIYRLIVDGHLLSLPELNVTWDQASWDVGAQHFCLAPKPGGMGLNSDFREDSYHRSWNDTDWAITAAGLKPACVQMHHPFNCNCLPIHRGINVQKKRAGKLELEALYPDLPAEWKELLPAAAADAGKPRPADAAEEEQLFDEQVRCNPDARTCGPLYRLSSWYSIIPAIKHKDHHWTLWATWVRWLARACLGNEKWSKAVRDQAARELLDAASKDWAAQTSTPHQATGFPLQGSRPWIPVKGLM